MSQQPWETNTVLSQPTEATIICVNNVAPATITSVDKASSHPITAFTGILYPSGNTPTRFTLSWTGFPDQVWSLSYPPRSSCGFQRYSKTRISSDGTLAKAGPELPERDIQVKNSIVWKHPKCSSVDYW